MTLSGCRLLAALVALGAGLSWCAAQDKKDETKLSKVEQRILDLTNEARAKEKLEPLKVNATLLKVARAHSANMARQHKMEHVLDDTNPAQRAEKAGYDYRSVGENIASGTKGASLAAIFKGWMDSKLHRENILNPKYQEIGIGLATDDKGETYYTQVFGTQRAR
jgi:uncharacterized protein YkwD